MKLELMYGFLCKFKNAKSEYFCYEVTATYYTTKGTLMKRLRSGRGFFSVCSEVVQELTIKWKSSVYQVFADAEVALRLNENSFKARLYKAKAHQELEELEEFQESKKELDEMFPQHADLIEYFLKKEENVSDEEEDWILFCLGWGIIV